MPGSELLLALVVLLRRLETRPTLEAAMAVGSVALDGLFGARSASSLETGPPWSLRSPEPQANLER